MVVTAITQPLTVEEIATAAGALLNATECRSPIEPLSDRHPLIQISDAYQIQVAQIDARLAEGDTVRGYKIGLTSEAMRAQMGVHEPDFGHLLASTFVDETIPLDRLIQPLAEPEIAVTLGSSLRGPGLKADEVYAAIENIHPAIEVVDSRIRNWRITIADTVADNASSGLVVLGNPISRRAIDIEAVTCTVWVDGDRVTTGRAIATLGSPVAATTWLANALGDFDVDLPAGSVILTGALTTAVPLKSGMIIDARFGALGDVRATVQ